MNTTTSQERHIICAVRSMPAHREAVKRLLLDLVEPARQEAGCLYYDLYQNDAEPDRFFIVDGWASDAAIAEHAKHPNVTRVVEQLLPLLEVPLQVSTNLRLTDR
jgi:quinol monooxygenase YgiN